MKKLIFSLAILSTFTGCAIFKGGERAPFKVDNVTSQKWYAGMAAGGKGTNYAFYLKIRDTLNFKVDTVWIDARPYRPQLVDVKEDQDMKKLIMSFSERPKNAGDPQGEWELTQSPKKSENPPVYDGTALIIYHQLGVRKTEIVKEKIEKLEPLNYP